MQYLGRRCATWGLLAVVQWNIMCMTLLYGQFEEEQEDIFLGKDDVRRAQHAQSELHDYLADSEDTTSLLPKRLITVFGTESSGSTFTATAIGIAAGVKSPNDKNSLSFRSWDFERNVEVQHISLPTGYGAYDDVCLHQQTGVKSQTLPVVLPAPCMVIPTKNKEQYARAQLEKRTFPEACRKEADLEDFVVYPSRFFVNVTSHIQWYRERGVRATAVIMMRDASISQISKIQSHCPLEGVAEQQNKQARQLMMEAIDKLDPSSEVVLVSYEGMMSLGRSYILDIYRQLGINSTYIPSFIDGNAKYVVAPEPRMRRSRRTFLYSFKTDHGQVIDQPLRPGASFKGMQSQRSIISRYRNSGSQYQNQFNPQQHGAYGAQPYNIGYTVDHFNQRGGYGPPDPYGAMQPQQQQGGSSYNSGGGMSSFQDDNDHHKGKKGGRGGFQQHHQQLGGQQPQPFLGGGGGGDNTHTASTSNQGWSNNNNNSQGGGWGGPSWQGGN